MAFDLETTSPLDLLCIFGVTIAMSSVEMRDVNVGKMAAGVGSLPGVSLVGVVTRGLLKMADET